MNYLSLSFVSLFLCIVLLEQVNGQAPSQFRFQAVGRDDEGKLLANTPIAVRFAIRTGSENGPVAYREQHNVITDEYGHFNASVGSGAVLTGDFNQIPWASASHFLQIEYNDGSGYKDLGASALLSVPYAIYSNQAGFASASSVSINTTPVLSGRGTTSEPLDIARQGATIGQVLKWNGNTWQPGADLDSDNQLLVLNGNNLSITNGNTISLPQAPMYTAGPGIQLNGLQIVNTGDLSNTNELQMLSKAGNQIILSQGGGAVTDEVNDADSDPTNELQVLSLNGNTLNLSQGGGAIDLSILGSKWNLSGNNIFRENGNVGIGVLVPEHRLHLAGSLFIDGVQGNLRMGQVGDGNQWWLGTNATGSDLQWIHRSASGSPFVRMILKPDGKLGLGEINPNASLVLGQNINTVRDFPALSVGNALGGALLLGNDDNNAILESGLQLPFTQLSLSGSLGENRGDLSIRGRGVHIGATHDQSPFKLRVSHETFGFALENSTSQKSWEFYVNEILNGIDLFYEGAYKGTFDAVTGAYFNLSDETYKVDIENLSNVGSKLSSLELKRFFYLDDKEQSSPQIGVSAQNLKQVFPELVRENELRDGTKLLTVNYAQLGVIALKAIQEQESKLQQMEEQIRLQQQTLEQLEKRLEKLELNSQH